MKNKPVILVVDDQHQNILLLEGFLVREKYEVMQAESGVEALGKLSDNQVDLVLLDVKMPRMSGFEVLTQIRADKKTRRIPVVMITSYNEHEARVKAFESGCDDFISKPFDQYELLARVKSLLRIKFLNDEVDEAREFAENIINTVREPLISLDQDLRVIAANHSFYNTFKVTPEETIGDFIYDLGNRQWDIPKLRVLFEEILPLDTVFNNYEVEHDFQGIGRKTILLNARQIYRENIGSHIILLAMEDITEHRLSEKALKESEEQFRALAEALQKLNEELEMRIAQRTKELEEHRDMLEEQAEELTQSLNSQEEEITERQMSEERLRLLIDRTKNYAIFMLDKDGRVISWNEGAKRLKEWDEQEILGRHFSLFYTEEDVAAGRPEYGLGLATAEGHFEERSWRVKKDGSKFMADVVITALRDDSGKLRGLSKVTHDITEHIQAMEVLREKEQMLIQQNRQAAMGEMISNIAHQWRQPLNTLGLSIQQLKLYYELGEFTEEFLNKSVISSMDIIQHMSKTIDDFRDYFRPDKEKGEFNIREVVESTLSLVEDSFKSKNIGVVVVANGDPAIHGFRNEFAQVLLNILNNAGDALAGRACIDCKITITFGSEDDCAVVAIADNAGGIPAEIINKIFDPYFTTKGPQQGTGLGLFMSKTIIEKNMGGKLTVQNIADGAEFRIEVCNGING